MLIRQQQVLEDKLEEVGSPRKQDQSNMEALALSVTTLGRVSVPDDVANAVSFLAGSDSDWITGQVRHDFSFSLLDPDRDPANLKTPRIQNERLTRMYSELGGGWWNCLQLKTPSIDIKVKVAWLELQCVGDGTNIFSGLGAGNRR